MVANGALSVAPIACAVLLGCGQDAAGQCGVERLGEPLTGGSPIASLVGLSSQEAAAVGLLNLTLQSGEQDRCTLTRISSQWAVTAKHCLSHAWDKAEVWFDEDVAEFEPRDVTVVLHPERDVALVGWVTPALGTATGLDWSRAVAEEVGARVQVAGGGLAESGLQGSVWYGVVQVAEVTPNRVSTLVLGAGPCAGDSGGPMLVRGTDGQPSIFAVLSKGSPTCIGGDVYERVAPVGDWIAQTVGETARGSGDCGGIGPEGRCFADKAVWCEGGRIAAAECGELSCGWDARASGYRCVPSEDDACGGISELGECRAGQAVRCWRGTALGLDCERCGGQCGISPSSGYASCDAEL